MNSLLYTANTTAQALTAGENVNFGTPVRRYGKNIYTTGGNVAVRGEGYYTVHASISFNAEDAGIAVIQLYEDGVEIPGATATKTVGAGSVYELSIHTAVRTLCCEEKVITAKILNVDSTVQTASMLVTKA